VWRVACGVWRVACGVCLLWRVACVCCGVWRVACGVWRVACGVWRVSLCLCVFVACGVCLLWRVACGVWRLACGVWCVTCVERSSHHRHCRERFLRVLLYRSRNGERGGVPARGRVLGCRPEPRSVVLEWCVSVVSCCSRCCCCCGVAWRGVAWGVVGSCRGDL
jgi:hypothetical protein